MKAIIAALLVSLAGWTASPPELVAQAPDWSSGVSYLYDGSGNVKQIGSDLHVYDAVGRLVQSDTSGVRRNFTYDAYGNRQTCWQAATSTDCQYGRTINSANNRIDGVNNYDAAGNLTSFDGHTYLYDAVNMQTQDAVGLTVREYIYTADDERIAVYTVNTGSWLWSVRDPSGKVLRDFTSQNGPTALGTANWAWVKDYVWRDGLLLATRQAEGAGAPPTTYHYHLDHLGTPRRITDDANQIIGAHAYHAFGPELEADRIDEPSHTRMKYTGHERDSDTSTGVAATDYMHARYYYPGLGRFLSVDPTWDSADLRQPQRWNRYSYVQNNPLNMVDPDGRVTLVDDAIILGALGAAAVAAWLQAESVPGKSHAEAMAESAGELFRALAEATRGESEPIPLVGRKTSREEEKDRRIIGQGGERVMEGALQLDARPLFIDAGLGAVEGSKRAVLAAGRSGARIFDIGYDPGLGAEGRSREGAYKAERRALVGGGYRPHRSRDVIIQGQITTVWEWTKRR